VKASKFANKGASQILEVRTRAPERSAGITIRTPVITQNLGYTLPTQATEIGTVRFLRIAINLSSLMNDSIIWMNSTMPMNTALKQ
jgi:hypothetical protein